MAVDKWVLGDAEAPQILSSSRSEPYQVLKMLLGDKRSKVNFVHALILSLAMRKKLRALRAH